MQSGILSHIGYLLKYVETTNSSKLESLIYNELYYVQLKHLYKCLSFIHPRKAINEIISNSFIPDGEYRMNAIELLENTLHPRDTHRVITLIERIFEYKTGYKEDFWGNIDNNIVQEIISNNNQDFQFMDNCKLHPSG